jgi:anaerobic selenocysteine-containing dehydrogenase
MSFDQVLQHVGGEEGTERIFDMLLRAGQYGDHFGDRPDGLTLAKLKETGEAMDFGPMKPRLKEMIYLPDGKIDFAPDLIVADLPRLEAWLDEDRTGRLHLVGRRQVRSCNTWMHNFPSLAKGPELCVLLINPEDAAERGITDGTKIALRSAQGRIEVPARISAEMRRGIVSLPHGWGHDDPGVPGQPFAKARPGVNYNLLADEKTIDVPSGNLNLNFIPVEVECAGLVAAE